MPTAQSAAHAAADPTRTGRPLAWLTTLAVVAVAAGLASGALTSFAQTVLPGPFAGLANGVTPWLVVPFAVGAWCASRGGRWPWALVAGVVACGAQVAGYYVTADLRGFAVGSTWTAFWLVCAVPGGALAGAAGWSWWAGRVRGPGAALLVAAWLAEALVGYALVLRYPGHAVVFAVAGAVTFWVLGRRGHEHVRTARWLLPATVLAGAGFGALHSL